MVVMLDSVQGGQASLDKKVMSSQGGHQRPVRFCGWPVAVAVAVSSVVTETLQVVDCNVACQPSSRN